MKIFHSKDKKRAKKNEKAERFFVFFTKILRWSVYAYTVPHIQQQ